MRTFFAFLLIVCSQPSFALSADDLIFHPEQVLTKSAQLTQAQVQEDLELLDLALQKGYEGQNFRDQLNRLAHKNTPEALCEELARVLEEVRNAHLRAYLDFKACGHPLQSGQVGPNIASGTDGWRAKEVEGVTVLAVPSFWPEFDSHWDGFLEKVSELRQKNKSFILDLRGNTGGDDSYGFELARILLGAGPNDVLPTPVASRTFRQTPEAFALQANAWAWSQLKFKTRGQSVPVAREQKRNEILRWMERAKHHEFPGRYEEKLTATPLDRAKIFSQPVYILIDRTCASSCENTLQVLESLPHRILVGENTLGAVEYGEVGRLILPNSRVSLSLTTMSTKFKDHRHPEKTGYPPDIKTQPNQNALNIAVKRIKETAKK